MTTAASENKHDILLEYINKSKLRVIIDDMFCARMSPEIAKNFDSGLYADGLNEHKQCITELNSLHIKYPGNAKPIFYIYIVPDDRFVELLQFPYTTQKGGGRPVQSYDLDGFNSAYGTSQNLLVNKNKPSIVSHINHIHEYAHLMQHQFGFGAQMFGEGFAEMIPWYALGYENLVPEHCASMKKINKIYTANELLGSVDFRDKVPDKTCSFQPSYMSAYLWIRAVVEHIRVQQGISIADAIQKLLELYHFIKTDKQWFIIELAKTIGMDADKLLNSTEYQQAQLKQIGTKQLLMNLKNVIGK